MTAPDLAAPSKPSGEQSPQDANTVVNLVAVFLGEHLCSTEDLAWAILTDETGTDLCIRSSDASWVFFRNPQSRSDGKPGSAAG